MTFPPLPLLQLRYRSRRRRTEVCGNYECGFFAACQDLQKKGRNDSITLDR